MTDPKYPDMRAKFFAPNIDGDLIAQTHELTRNVYDFKIADRVLTLTYVQHPLDDATTHSGQQYYKLEFPDNSNERTPRFTELQEDTVGQEIAHRLSSLERNVRIRKNGRFIIIDTDPRRTGDLPDVSGTEIFKIMDTLETEVTTEDGIKSLANKHHGLRMEKLRHDVSNPHKLEQLTEEWRDRFVREWGEEPQENLPPATNLAGSPGISKSAAPAAGLQQEK